MPTKKSAKKKPALIYNNRFAKCEENLCGSIMYYDAFYSFHEEKMEELVRTGKSLVVPD
jgi:hypothetical protein